MSFGELGRIIGGNWLCLDNIVSWSPRRHLGGRTSEPDGASEDLWHLSPYPLWRYFSVLASLNTFQGQILLAFPFSLPSSQWVFNNIKSLARNVPCLEECSNLNVRDRRRLVKPACYESSKIERSENSWPCSFHNWTGLLFLLYTCEFCL